MNADSPNIDKDRKVALSEAEEDLRKPIAQLLTDVHHESLISTDVRSREFSLGRTMARFASLLSRLSIDAEESTRRIIRLTWGLVVLTITLIFLTAFLCFNEFRKGESTHDQHSDTAKPRG